MTVSYNGLWKVLRQKGLKRQNLVGIVVNAFTEPFVLDSQIWDLVERMKSRMGSDGC